MAKGNLVGYGEFSADAAKKARQEIEDEGNEFIKIKEGWTVMRILPPPEGTTTPFRKVYTHYLPHATKRDTNIPVTCPRMTKIRDEETGALKRQGRSCPVCEMSQELRASGNQLDKDRGYDIRPQPRVFVNVINRKDPSMQIRVWGVSKTLYDELVAIREDPEEPTDYTHPLEGYDIRIHRKGTKKNDTEYKLRLAKRPSPLAMDGDGEEDFDSMNELIQGQHDLDRYSTLPNDEDILTALEGKAPQRLGSGDGGEERPRSRRNSGSDTSDRRARRRKAGDDAKDSDVVDAEFEEGGGDDDDDDDDLPDGM